MALDRAAPLAFLVHGRLSLPLNLAFETKAPWFSPCDGLNRESAPSVDNRFGARQMARIQMGYEEAAIAPNAATAGILFELGMRYCSGHEVEQNYVAAHKWFNLAALKGSEEARFYRSELSREMTAAEVHEAQRLARAWLTLH
jgi:TPR repeat protein